MALFDAFSRANFTGPNYNQGQDFGSDVLPYVQSRANDAARFQTDLMKMQSALRLKELGQSLAIQQQAAQKQKLFEDQQPKNVIYQPLIDPYKAGQLALQAKKIGVTEENNAQKNQVGQQNADTAARRADISAQLANNPNYVQVRSKGGTIQYMDKKTGEVIDTGVNAGTMTDTEAANTKEANAEQLERVKQNNRATNLNTKGQQIINQIKTRGEETRKTKETASPNTNQDLPSQQKIASQIRANEFINNHPEYKDFIQIDPNTGMVNVTPPGNSFMGNSPSPAQWKEIMDGIFPNQSTSTSTGGEKRLRVKVPDGKGGYMIGTLPASKAKQPGIIILGEGQ